MTKKVVRNFPTDNLEEALSIPQKIQDDKAGKPFNRLLLADSLAIKPGSSNFRDLLSSSYKYGFTEGTEKAPEIKLTSLGIDATQTKDAAKRIVALRKAALTPKIFNEFYSNYANHKLPSSDMIKKILISDYKVPEIYAEECAKKIIENGRFAEIIRDIGGSAHVLLDAETNTTEIDEQVTLEIPEIIEDRREALKSANEASKEQGIRRAIFIGHGKKKGPLEKLQKILSSFQIPYKVAVDEANLGRPIPQKVKEVMQQCGSAILIFTCDEKFYGEDRNEIWRPSENVVYELGAASFAYEDRIVIFKEKGIHFPTNFQSIGYIEFEENSIEAKTTELLKELIGFGLIKITTS